jgi:DNA-binding NarL/FixJ family response regulator
MLADDHNLGRQTFGAYIESYGDGIKVIGEAANGLELLDLLKNKIPDLVILDLEMPVLDGYKTLKILVEKFPTVKTIILSTHYNEFFISELMIAGACGYLPKNCFADDVFETINKVYTEGFYFNNSVSRQVVTTLIDERKLQYLVSERILSDREIEVLQEMCNEKQGKEIAEALKISENTVAFHKKNIYVKTNCQTLVGLVKYAIRTGIALP